MSDLKPLFTCAALTAKGVRCPIPSWDGNWCHVHDPNGEYRRQHPKFKPKTWREVTGQSLVGSDDWQLG